MHDAEHERLRTTVRVTEAMNPPKLNGRSPFYVDQAVCSCGWAGGYHIYASGAHKEWEEHAGVPVAASKRVNEDGMSDV